MTSGVRGSNFHADEFAFPLNVLPRFGDETVGTVEALGVADFLKKICHVRKGSSRDKIIDELLQYLDSRERQCLTFEPTVIANGILDGGRGLQDCSHGAHPCLFLFGNFFQTALRSIDFQIVGGESAIPKDIISEELGFFFEVLVLRFTAFKEQVFQSACLLIVGQDKKTKPWRTLNKGPGLEVEISGDRQIKN